jgi:integrase/recombinase XerD
MLNEDVLKEFIFDCRMRKLSERTLVGYKNNNLAMFQIC